MYDNREGIVSVRERTGLNWTRSVLEGSREGSDGQKRGRGPSVEVLDKVVEVDLEREKWTLKES